MASKTLDVVIIKNAHASTEDAKQTWRAVRDCDVIAPESAQATHAETAQSDAMYARAQKDAEFRRELLKDIAHRLSTHAEGPYNLHMLHKVFSCGKPIIHAERFAEEDAEYLQELYLKGEVLGEHMAMGLCTLDNYVKNFWTRHKLSAENVNLRDQNIAANIKDGTIRQRINRTYPHLRNTRVKYGVIVGSAHAPERYLDKAEVRTVQGDYPHHLDREFPRNIVWEMARDGKTIRHGRDIIARIFAADVLYQVNYEKGQFEMELFVNKSGVKYDVVRELSDVMTVGECLRYDDEHLERASEWADKHLPGWRNPQAKPRASVEKGCQVTVR